MTTAPARLPADAGGSSGWLLLGIDDWRAAVRIDQVVSLEEAARVTPAVEGHPCGYSDLGWPVVGIDHRLRRSLPRARRFILYLRGKPTPLGVHVDQAEVLKPSTLSRIEHPPAVAGLDPLVRAVLVLSDGSLAVQIDGEALATRVLREFTDGEAPPARGAGDAGHA